MCTQIITTVFGQAGANDASFNPTDIGFGNGDGASSIVWATVVQNDGKILIGGQFTSYNGTAINRIARLNSDGSLDASFDPGSGANNTVLTLALQSDGKILIGGYFTAYNGTTRNNIARLNSDGSLDASFDPGSGANSFVYTTVLQSDGKILIGGGFTDYNGTARNYLARLNSDGSLDASFNSGANSEVRTIALQSDGKILIGGLFQIYNGTARNRIARLNSDGSLDASFDPGSGANSFVYTTVLQSDGKILIGGQFTSYNSIARNYLARLNSDGSLDASFNLGTGANSQVQTLAIQSDGKILIGGAFTSYNGTGRNRIARLNSDGSLDASFDPGSGANSAVITMAVQSTGKIVISGQFNIYSGTARNFHARLNSDGSLDASFNPVWGANGVVITLAVQSDGRILIGGQFTSYNGTARNNIARLNSDGSLDASFNPGSGAYGGAVRTIAVQSDGRILIGGQFTSYNGTARNNIARLNSDGSLDASFDPGTGANNTVFSTLVLQSDGRILISGFLSAYNGTVRNGIALLNSDGSLDASFNPGSGANSGVYTTSVQSDGRILIGGAFTSYNGTGRNRVARLNSDGSLDESFDPGTGANDQVRTIAVQSDSKILIGYNFTAYNGTTRTRIARLNSDGSLDASFDPGSGANNTIATIVLQSDGKILIGGNFTSYNGTGRNRIARILGETLLTWYQDQDEDGYGNPNVNQVSGTQPDGYVADNTDCDDNNAAINPATKWYNDADGDDYGTGAYVTQCARPADGFLSSELTATTGDCNDGNVTIYPSAQEIFGNGVDENCDGIDNCYPAGTACDDGNPNTRGDVEDGNCNCVGVPIAYDNDNDGYPSTEDCDDHDNTVYPGALELCDGKDNDCDDLIDEDKPVVAPITGTTTLCPTGTTQLSNAILGGVWQSGNTNVATINASGLVTGVAEGTAVITYTVSDSKGCATTVQATVTVEDDLAPVPDVTTLPDITAECTVTISTKPKATDNCKGTITATTADPLTYSTQGEYVIHWTYNDGNGNTSIQTQNVIVRDFTDPSITAPADVTTTTDAGLCSASGVVVGTPVVGDNCDGVTYQGIRSDGQALSAAYPVGITTITWRATDVGGNTSETMHTVTVNDEEAPVFTAPANRSASLGSGCSFAVPDLLAGLSGNDNCGTVSFSQSPIAGTIINSSHGAIVTVMIIADDGNGNQSQKGVLLSVLDVTDPTITAPIAIIAQPMDAGSCSAAKVNVSLGNPITGDNCTVASVSNNAPDVFPEGTTIVTWTVMDGAGNTTTATQSVTVVDNQLPIVLTKNVTINLDATGSASITAAQVNNGSTDNCGIVSISLDKSSFNCSNLGANTIHLIVTDVNGNEAEEHAIVTVVDNINPTIEAPATITVNNDAGQCYATITSLGTPMAADNCTYTVSNNAPVNNQFPVGTTTVTWTVTDGSGNTATATQTITVIDNQLPIVITKNITKQLGSGGTVSIIPSEVNNGSYDNCGAVTLVSVSPNTFNCTHLGANTVTLTVRDASGNTNTATAIVTVTALQAVATVSVAPTTQQYSDQVTFTATLSPGQVPGSCTPATSVTFKVGTQVMGTVPLTLNNTTGKLQASLTAALFEVPNSSQMSPGVKTVTAVFNGVGTAFIVTNPTTSLTITKEDARITYTGSMFASTSSATSSTATVTLSATIQDITGVSGDPSYDAYAGDIRKARVRFINRDNGTYISGWLTPGLVSATDIKTGTVTYNWSVNIGNQNSATYTVGVIVDNGYYIRNSSTDNTVVTVSKPLGDFITGGGYLIMKSSAGLKAGDVNSRNNFGFNVKYNKSNKNLQGHINIIIRRKESDGVQHVYQIKGNSMTSLSVNARKTSTHPYPTAVFDGKASIQDITNPLAVISVDGNASLHATMTDKGEPGSSDMIGITVWDKNGGMWFSSNWDGTKTVEQILGGGNLKVSTNSSFTAGGQTTTVLLTSSVNPSEHGQPVTFTATVTPKDKTKKSGGKVTFTNEHNILAAVEVKGSKKRMTAKWRTDALPVGEHVVTAVYSNGDGTESGISDPHTHKVIARRGKYQDEKFSQEGSYNSTAGEKLQVIAYPNPAPYSFNLVTKSSSDQPLKVLITDVWGRVIEARNNVAATGTLVIGDNYRPGTYFAEVVQGKGKVTVKLVKLSE